MQWNHGLAILEALLFASPEPVTQRRLAEVMGLEPGAVKGLLADLKAAYDSRRGGLTVQEVAGGWQLVTRPEHAELIEQLLTPRGRGLSHAALETLAVIAYRQPATKADVEAVRGVKVDSSLSTLLDHRLIREAGRKEGPGRPILYATTKEFLLYFGLSDLSELPPLASGEAETASPLLQRASNGAPDWQD